MAGEGVASFTDAWIETLDISHGISVRRVASFTDAWIETYTNTKWIEQVAVASFTDAWIETKYIGGYVRPDGSHLLQMRGLKPERL